MPLILAGDHSTFTLGSCTDSGTPAKEHDWFKVTIPAGNGARFTLQVPTAVNAPDLDLTLYLATNTHDALKGSLQVSPSNGAIPDEVVQVTMVPDDTDVLVQVFNYGDFQAVPLDTPYTLVVDLLVGGGT
ncbi:MAG: hypothetical protein HY904_17550 [Deltaproteobacteria bacterium]|nr:hypothetical protein [Deltaproteobacteria bacterium]